MMNGTDVPEDGERREKRTICAKAKAWISWITGDRLVEYFDKVIGILVIAAAWEAVPRLGWIDPFLLPPLSAVLRSIADLFSTGQMFVHIGASFNRSFTAFMIAVGFAVPTGFFIATSKTFEKYVDPLLQVCRSIPILSLYPVFILFFGLSEKSKIAVILFGTVWPALLNTISGVDGIEPALIKAAKSMGISGVSLFFKVILPSALPSLLTGIRLSAANAILLLVAAEMLGANKGLGYLIFYSEEKYDIPIMFGGILTIAVIGVVINWLLVGCEKRLTGWKQNPGEF
jgi:NitT/TauT family transport system permease protein